MTFSGFPQDIFRFYRNLSENNTREWWRKHRFLYDDLIIPVIAEFIDDLDPEWLPMTVYRPHRDVRFSKDKTPYKEHVGTIGYSLDGNLHYLHIAGEGMFAARGMHQFSRDQLFRYREAIDKDDDETFRSAIDQCRASGLRIQGWKGLSTVPRGYPKDHPRADLLRLSGIDVMSGWVYPSETIRTRKILSDVQRAWRDASPVTDWLGRHVGSDIGLGE